MSSKRYSSLLLTALFVSSTAAAMAGSKSMLDPYAAVQPPPSKKPKTAVRAAQQESAETTHTTYISMPMPAEGQEKKASKWNLLAKHPKQPKEQKEEKVAEAKPEPKHDSDQPGIAAKSIASVKNAGSGIVGGTKAAGTKIVEGSKAVGGGIASGTKKIGGGIASGAKASGGYLLKGVTAIGHGFKATGDKVKGGAGSAGTKVAGLPKLWGKKGNDQERAKQQAIAKAIAERKAAQDPSHQIAKEPAGAAKDSEWNDESTGTGANEVKSASVPQVPVINPKAIQSQSFKAAKAPSPKGQSKLAGITGGFSKAFGKLNPFGGKSTTANAPNLQHAIVRPQSEIQSTAATSDAIPQ